MTKNGCPTAESPRTFFFLYDPADFLYIAAMYPEIHVPRGGDYLILPGQYDNQGRNEAAAGNFYTKRFCRIHLITTQ